MKLLNTLAGACALLVLATTALAHDGHGIVGSTGHDLQHQLWNFAGLILLGVLALGSSHIAVLVRGKSRSKDAGKR